MTAKFALGAVVLHGWIACGAFADLYATSGNTRSDLLHYSVDGQSRQRLPLGAESFGSLVRGPDGDLYALGNTLGYGDLFRIDPFSGLAASLLPHPPANPFDPRFTLPSGLVFDGTGKIYVGSSHFLSGSLTAVLRFDPSDGQLKPFASIPDQEGPVTPRGFDADGNLLVSQVGGIGRYDGATGQFLNFVNPPPIFGETGPDGNLYIGTLTQGVLRYKPDGTLLGTFIPPGSGGLSDVTDLSFGNDGLLYVNSQKRLSVLRFDAVTGGFVDTFRKYGQDNEYLWEIQAVSVPEPLMATALLSPAVLLIRHRRSIPR